MTRRRRIGLIGLGILGLAAIGLALGRTGSKAPAEAPSTSERVVPVATAVASARDVPIFVEGLGTVRSLATVLVRTQVDGRLERVLFEEGQLVKRGDPLALVDPRPFELQLAQGEASLLRDTATKNQAELDLRRYVNLVRQNLIPQQQVDQQRVARDQAAAAMKADEAAIGAAKLSLGYAHIRSPVDGVTGIRQVDPGNIVHPGDTTGIVVVTQLDPIGVLFTLPQDVLPKVQAALARGRPYVAAQARDDDTLLGEGTLELVDNLVVPDTATLRLKAVLPNAKRSLWPNQFVKARLHLETIPNALVIPAAAVTRSPHGTSVYVVDASLVVSARDVTVARIQGEDAILTRGLTDGEVVVTDGQSQLRPGSKVAPRAKVPPAALGALPDDPHRPRLP